MDDGLGDGQVSSRAVPASEALIPDEARELYEALIDEGGRLLPTQDPTWTNRTTRALLTIGLGVATPWVPPMLTPVPAAAAVERLLVRWLWRMEKFQRSYRTVPAVAIRLQRAFVGAASSHNHVRFPCVLIVGKRQTGTIHEALVASAERFTAGWITAPYGELLSLPTGEPHPVSDLYFAPPAEFRAHGGVSRVLVDQPTVVEFPDVPERGYWDGEELRMVHEKLPMKLLIVDDRVALVPLGPYGNPCLLIRSPLLVNLFARFFALMWAQGEPWAPPGVQAKAAKCDTVAPRVLELMAAGLKDDAIARQCGVSVRTVRRHIAEMMDEFGAQNRFAAGVAAVRSGRVKHS